MGPARPDIALLRLRLSPAEARLELSVEEEDVGLTAMGALLSAGWEVSHFFLNPGNTDAARLCADVFENLDALLAGQAAAEERP